jgi:hypothetical protein
MTNPARCRWGLFPIINQFDIVFSSKYLWIEMRMNKQWNPKITSKAGAEPEKPYE